VKATWIAWALTLGLAFTALAVPAAVVPSEGAASVPETQDLARDGGDATPYDRCGCENRSEYVTIGLAVRWGYLDDPAILGMEGRWRWNEDGMGGGFHGMWKGRERDVGGHFQGRFAIADDGHGRFSGEWNLSTGRDGGFLAGAWDRVDRGHGVFDGRWNFTDGRPGGAMGGSWAAMSEEGGGMRGMMIHAPTMDMVDWDGFLKVSDGAVRLERVVRWETGGDRRFGGDDQILRRHDRTLVEWTSTTTVNWDGLVFAIHLPRERNVSVTLPTDQAEFTWGARELFGLHLRRPVDRLGHEIEVRTFRLDRDNGHDRHDAVRIMVGMRWGHLDTRGEDRKGDAKSWAGGSRISVGGLDARGTLSFERGDHLLRDDNRQIVRWVSNTTTGWDGVLLVALVPLDRIGDVTFSVHAGEFEHTWTLRELMGRHTYDFDDGTSLEVRGMRV
jgi:hypothetical protein